MGIQCTCVTGSVDRPVFCIQCGLHSLHCYGAIQCGVAALWGVLWASTMGAAKDATYGLLDSLGCRGLAYCR